MLKSRPGDEQKQSKVAPEMEKTHICRSAVLGNFLSFFEQVFTIRVAMGAVEIRIAPEASPFRGDADFDGPGAWGITTFRKIWFLIFCRKFFDRKKSLEIFLSCSFFVKGFQ